MTLLRAEAVRKHFGEHQVLRGVDCSVAAGEVVCLIGASGSGKSTLLRCLNLLEPVTDGTVWFDGRDISDPRVDADAVRRDIGMVFQSYNLFPHLSVLGNVTLAPRRLNGLSKAAAQDEAEVLLARFGLADKVHAYPDSLSGGQQQRVALVQALAMRPREGLTVVMATHEMTFARDVADRVVFLDGGVVLEEGPPSVVLSAPRHERTATFLRRFLTR
jgi:polar amino acid transport system ATP-binding protein